MRQKAVKKVKQHYLKYVVYDKKEGFGQIYHYKKGVAELVGVSTRTLDRKMPFENENYLVFEVKKLNL